MLWKTFPPFATNLRLERCRSAQKILQNAHRLAKNRLRSVVSILDLEVGLRREEENHAHRREEESSDRKTQFTELYPKMNCHNKTQFDFFPFSLSRSEMVGHSFTKFQSCPCLNNLPPSEHVQSRSESEERHCWAEAVDVASHGNVDRVLLHGRVLRGELLDPVHQELDLMVACLHCLLEFLLLHVGLSNRGEKLAIEVVKVRDRCLTRHGRLMERVLGI